MDEVFLDRGVLCTSKELMEHRVTTWTDVWGTSSNPRQTSKNFSGFEQTCRDLQQLHPMEPIDADDVRKCMAGAPAKAAVGSDQWRPHDWASLPDEGIHDVVQLLHKIEEKGRWPEQVLCDLVVFIGKPTPVPSERPISLTSGLYRLWCKLRKPLIEEWEGKAAGFWDRAIAGSSALQAALARELRHEIAHHVGACTGGVYFDMAKFYDTLQPDIVLEKAAGLGFPPLVLRLALMVHTAPRILRAGGLGRRAAQLAGGKTPAGQRGLLEPGHPTTPPDAELATAARRSH